MALLETPNQRIDQVPEETRAALAEDLTRLIPRTREIWLKRNRTGGLDKNIGYLEALMAAYRGEPRP